MGYVVYQINKNTKTMVFYYAMPFAPSNYFVSGEYFGPSATFLLGVLKPGASPKACAIGKYTWIRGARTNNLTLVNSIMGIGIGSGSDYLTYNKKYIYTTYDASSIAMPSTLCMWSLNGKFIRSVTISARGALTFNRKYICMYLVSSGIIEMYHPDTLKRVETITLNPALSANSRGLAYDGKYFWIYDNTDKYIYKYDVKGNQIGGFSLGLSPIFDVTCDNNYLYLMS